MAPLDWSACAQRFLTVRFVVHMNRVERMHLETPHGGGIDEGQVLWLC
jgi:hypothetical protein